jgi:hypothetical protein
MTKTKYPYNGGIIYKWPTCVIAEIEDLGTLQDELAILADNLKVVGNTSLSEQIDGMAHRISNSRENLRQSIQIKVDSDVKYYAKGNMDGDVTIDTYNTKIDAMNIKKMDLQPK